MTPEQKTFQRWTPQRDTSNKLKLRPSAGHFCFETPTASPVLCLLTRDDLLAFAAWAVVLTEGDNDLAEMAKEIRR